MFHWSYFHTTSIDPAHSQIWENVILKPTFCCNKEDCLVGQKYLGRLCRSTIIHNIRTLMSNNEAKWELRGQYIINRRVDISLGMYRYAHMMSTFHVIMYRNGMLGPFFETRRFICNTRLLFHFKGNTLAYHCRLLHSLPLFIVLKKQSSRSNGIHVFKIQFWGIHGQIHWAF